MRQGLQRIPVFYSDDMLASAGSFSPSAGKPRHVLAAWQAAGLPITLRSFTPASDLRPAAASRDRWHQALLLCAVD
jgi:hypothetical protein